MGDVVALVRAAGVDCYVTSTGGNCATIFAGPTRTVEDGPYLTRLSACCAGPGSYDVRAPERSLASFDDFVVGPDDQGEATPIVVDEVGARTVEQVAALIIAQARLDDPTVALTLDEVQALGLDGWGIA